MSVTTVFPAGGVARPAGVIIKQTEKLKFTLSTDSPAPVFAFFADTQVEWDQNTADRQTTASTNTYTWDHPTSGFGNNQMQTLLLKVPILDSETYLYRIEKVSSTGATAKLLEEKMSGAGSIGKSDFELGVL